MCLDVYKIVLMMCLRYKRDMVVRDSLMESECKAGFGYLSCAI